MAARLSTPRKKGISVDGLLEDLNETYNIGLDPPQLRSSSRGHAGEADLIDKITKRLRFHTQAAEGQLSLILEEFDERARVVGRRWVQKPHGDQDTISDPSSPPKAITSAERSELRRELLSILEQRSPRKQGQPEASVELPPIPQPDFQKPKRPSGNFDLENNGPSKRLRGREKSQRIGLNLLDGVPVRQRAGKDRLVAHWTQTLDVHTPSDNGGDSANSSKLSLASSVFMTPAQQPSDQTTQTTIEYASQELEKLGPSYRESFTTAAEIGEVVTLAVNAPTSGFSGFPSNFATSAAKATSSRLQALWPPLPDCLLEAHFAVIWEITRHAVHCGVDLQSFSATIDDRWLGLESFIRLLREHDLFRGKSFPPKCDSQAWVAATTEDFKHENQDVVFSAVVAPGTSKAKPFTVRLRPPTLERCHRLSRKFGSDRFLEVLVPSDNEAMQQWITQPHQRLVGRTWAPFFVQDSDDKNVAREAAGIETKKQRFERVHLFAEGGVGIGGKSRRSLRSSGEHGNRRVSMTLYEALDWLLQFKQNESQPFLKLFSRIKLGMSRTDATVVLRRDQIRIEDEDLKSPTGNVMNDGIGLMSASLVRNISKAMRLDSVPCGFQGRFGCAKGVWIQDVSDTGDDDDWISLYPSQRKWECDFDDEHHRTFEVSNYPTAATPSALNFQFLPVLEDRAVNKQAMRSRLRELVMKGLSKELESLRNALKAPLRFLAWVDENMPAGSRVEIARRGFVPFMAGLPQSDGDKLNFLVASGFDPAEEKFVQDIARKYQVDKCEYLKQKMRIGVGRSATMYMVVDFWGLLKEDEVHVGFSTTFRDADSEFADTLLHGQDVLVARSPAHFPSDIQRVKAVFNPKLRALKDVVVFPRTGNVALADKLSGGDYDGDRAWVCWDPAIVEHFQNADVPQGLDAILNLRKDKRTFRQLREQHGAGRSARREAFSQMISEAMIFNMQPKYLGLATSYKEQVCYEINTVSHDRALLLSALLSSLVDQAKQGILFTRDDWANLQRDTNALIARERGPGKKGASTMLAKPAYKEKTWKLPPAGSKRTSNTHINDFLKFEVVIPAIEHELHALSRALDPPSLNKSSQGQSSSDNRAKNWDPALAKMAEDFDLLADGSRTWGSIIKALRDDLDAIHKKWGRDVGSRMANESFASATGLISTGGGGPGYTQAVLGVYEAWQEIRPRIPGQKVASKTIRILLQPDFSTFAYVEAADLFTASRTTAPRQRTAMSGLPDPEKGEIDEYCLWALLRASVAYKLFPKSANFSFSMAGVQLARLKAASVELLEKAAGRRGKCVTVVPSVFAALRPDKKFITKILAEKDGVSTVAGDPRLSSMWGKRGGEKFGGPGASSYDDDEEMEEEYFDARDEEWLGDNTT